MEAAALGSEAVEPVEDEFEGLREHPSAKSETDAIVDDTSKERRTGPIFCRRRGFIDLTLVSVLKV